MAYPHRLICEDGMVRSTRYPKRCGNARVIISTGRWPSGETLTGSDAITIARYLIPCKDGRRSQGWKVTHE